MASTLEVSIGPSSFPALASSNAAYVSSLVYDILHRAVFPLHICSDFYDLLQQVLSDCQGDMLADGTHVLSFLMLSPY